MINCKKLLFEIRRTVTMCMVICQYSMEDVKEQIVVRQEGIYNTPFPLKLLFPEACFVFLADFCFVNGGTEN